MKTRTREVVVAVLTDEMIVGTNSVLAWPNIDPMHFDMEEHDWDQAFWSDNDREPVDDELERYISIVKPLYDDVVANEIFELGKIAADTARWVVKMWSNGSVSIIFETSVDGEKYHDDDELEDIIKGYPCDANSIDKYTKYFKTKEEALEYINSSEIKDKAQSLEGDIIYEIAMDEMAMDETDEDRGYDPWNDYDDDPFVQSMHNQWLDDKIRRG